MILIATNIGSKNEDKKMSKNNKKQRKSKRKRVYVFFTSLGKKFKNRRVVYIIVKVIDKVKQVFVVIVVAAVIWVCASKSATAVGSSLLYTSGSMTIERVIPNYDHKSLSLMKERAFRINAFDFHPQSLFLLSVHDPRVLSNESILKLIKDLRGGHNVLVSTCLFVAFIFAILNGSDGFITPSGWGQNPAPAPVGNFPPVLDLFHRPGQCPRTSLEIQKPTSMPQVDYEAMPTAEKRLLDDPNDRVIEQDNQPRIRLAFNQIRFKTPKHGKIHGLPVDESGKASKNDAPILIDKLEQQAYSEKTKWYKNESFQDQDSVNLYSPHNGILTVYKKINGENVFLTTLLMTNQEFEHFEATNGHFVSEKILLSPNSYNNNNGN